MNILIISFLSNKAPFDLPSEFAIESKRDHNWYFDAFEYFQNNYSNYTCQLISGKWTLTDWKTSEVFDIEVKRLQVLGVNNNAK